MSGKTWEDEATYRRRFREINGGLDPYPYQVELARRLTAGDIVCLRAPTGSGKTRAVLTPFLVDEIIWQRGRPSRLIYALPLRSLVQQIHREATELLRKSGREEWLATIQTGEQPDDEFFDRGKIIVTTYDQVLSGLLCAPYGLSKRLRNVNAGALAGALVVFDEFHLMGLQTALLTGAAGLRLFRGLSQSVWMTATATEAPAGELARALGCVDLSLSEAETGALPVVATTQREFRRESEPLTAEAITQHASGRTIVIVNTVERAQNLYLNLEKWATDNQIPLRCLHARFFKSDRDERVAELRRLFGPGTRAPAVLIATQVVEAGIDVSCDHLLTELCPMNALLQRAGRCARFEKESGIVHVHSLPEGDHTYLPYGTVSAPDPALEGTDAVLRERTGWIMLPQLAEQWVQRVHGDRDAAVIDQIGWIRRFGDVRSRIHTSLTKGGAVGVSELIREDDDSRVRAIVAPEHDRPAAPGEREALAVSRWSLAQALRGDGPAVAWYWDLSADEPTWRELRTRQDLLLAFVVCLSPGIANYSSGVGLRLGETGEVTSPPRQAPKHPGYGSLRQEAWTTHTRGVTREIEHRWGYEGDGSLTEAGFRHIRRVSGEQLLRALRACAVIHDIGKLQQCWQNWATRYQRDRDPSWVAMEPLAHTDFDPKNPQDRDRSRRITGRVPHAVASAWYGQVLLGQLLMAPAEVLPPIAAACTAAVVGHHGGWIPDTGASLEVAPLVTGWEDLVAAVSGARPTPTQLSALRSCTDQRGQLSKLLDRAVGPENLEDWFALGAYLTRALRLADQHATAEGGGE